MRQLAGMLVLAAALAACSTPEQKAPEIASLNTGGAAPSAPATTTTTEQRPRERLDMTSEDIDALYEVYSRCQAEHGVDKSKFEKSGVPSKEVMDAANKACLSKNPLPPWEKDANNPEAVDFAQRVVQCLRGKGVRYVEVDNQPGEEAVSYALGGPNNDSQSITLGLQYSKECEIAASRK
ncbi:hypothetical protein JOF56_006958 [Kibdelosporangium banguiense]|uniref:Lipoprotein n=1 Tax=Kibdelosporangium banguiense TaxID=1365924 RepID=A0ABS4TRN6_9PSEU|nr:hypothetical protein [Kibdelosporangium banguiense]MBP2326573.1 hypothetical protein [Kibdelosporangium banguiense]